VGREPLTFRRAIISALIGALATGVLWTLLTGDLERGASFGLIALFVLLAWVILDQRRRR
jgi:Flp pilus assembly protein TadB